MKSRFMTGVAAGIMVLVLALAWAAVTPPEGAVIEDHESTDGSSYIGKSGGNLLKQAQQFFLDPEDVQPVTGIGLLLKETDYGDPQGDITVTLYANASGNVPGDPVEGSTRSFTPVLGTWNYVSFGDSPVPLESGSENKYWIVAETEDQAGDNAAWCWHRSGSNTYDRGYRKTFNLSGDNTWSGSQSGDFAFRIYGSDASLDVSMVSLTASPSENGIRVRWTTGSEVRTLGFHVYRSESEQGPFARVTASLIPSQGDGASGHTYTWDDVRAVRGRGYWYEVREETGSGMINSLGRVYGLCDRGGRMPDESRLFCNYPNPFNPSTRIWYHVAEKNGFQPVSLALFNVRGEKVRTLAHHVHQAGVYEVEWDGKDETGKEAASGLYFYRLEIAGRVVATRRMMKMK